MALQVGVLVVRVASCPSTTIREQCRLGHGCMRWRQLSICYNRRNALRAASNFHYPNWCLAEDGSAVGDPSSLFPLSRYHWCRGISRRMLEFLSAYVSLSHPQKSKVKTARGSAFFSFFLCRISIVHDTKERPKDRIAYTFPESSHFRRDVSTF